MSKPSTTYLQQEDLHHQGATHSWCSSYLGQRTQTFCANAQLSGPHVVDCSVPQGSVLGPQKFSQFIHEGPSRSDHQSSAELSFIRRWRHATSWIDTDLNNPDHSQPFAELRCSDTSVVQFETPSVESCENGTNMVWVPCQPTEDSIT